jgi:hypothetical protein
MGPASLGLIASALLVVLSAAQPSPPSPPMDCAPFTSGGKLRHGQSFSTGLPLGYELRLSSDGVWAWDISIGRKGGKFRDYMWVVSPPFETGRAHALIGPGYGLQARDSVGFERRLRFALNDTDYEAALKMVRGERLSEPGDFERLGQGTLRLKVTSFETRKVPNEPFINDEALEWIEFVGEACVPRQP